MNGLARAELELKASRAFVSVAGAIVALMNGS